MLFSSSVFLFLFLPIVIFVYYLLLKWNRTLQNLFLFVVSILFYAYGEPKFVLIMLASIFMNWLLGLFMGKYRSVKWISRIIIVLTLVMNLSIIFIFKYLMFTGEIINGIFSLDLKIPEITLPIGISFFTFQAISYVIDIYRGQGKAQNNPFYVGLYISFFPQLIAGPIVRYETVAEEILHRRENWKDFTEGCYRFMVGFCKKVLLANNLAIVANQAFGTDMGQLTLPMAWLGSIAYTFQIFFDFSGYSDMAIGLGKMFGFHFLENFNYPYISASVSEFWRRWHISLSSFFRDYVYIPLGGSRVSRGRLFFNLSVVWFLTGLWHGANWTFIVWGIYYLCFLTIEKLVILHQKSKHDGTQEAKEQKGLLKCLKHVYTLFVVNLGWVLFNSPSIQDAIQFMFVMFGKNGFEIDHNFLMNLNENKVYLVAAVLFSTPWLEVLGRTKLPKPIHYLGQGLLALCVFVLFLVAETFLVKGTYNPFIYFNF